MTLNDIRNVHLIQAGLGAKEASAEVLIEDKKGKGLGGSSRIVESAEPDNVTERVKIVALDEVIPKDREISILQLDVEGYEQEALKGAIELIRRCKPILILEDDKGATESTWFTENILGLGYEIDSNLHYNKLILPKG